ncbi:MAG: N-acetylmuramoyl-L-alanine amidase [bacterium]|nr:N-acetylmuramoyl-L-alanine amidase [bacterium]
MRPSTLIALIRRPPRRGPLPHWRAVLLLGAAVLAAAGARAAAGPAATTAPTLRAFNSDAQSDHVIFRLEFSQPPTMRVNDDLLRHRYFYLDFYGVAGPVEALDKPVRSPLVYYVKRVYYADQKVLRFVFYSQASIRFSVTRSGPNTQIVTVRPLRLAPLGSAKRAPGAGPTTPRKMVVLDPGHGETPGVFESTAGSQTYRRINGRHYYEKDLVLEIAQRLENIIAKSPNLDCVLTRSDNRYLSLPDRVQIADEAQGDLFISIHMNGNDRHSRKTARGFEVYYLSNIVSETNRQLVQLENDGVDMSANSGNEALRDIFKDLWNDKFVERQAESRELATVIDDEFRRSGPFRQYDRGVKAGALRVLMNFNMPAVLVECGFLDTPAEASELIKPAVQDRIAALLFNGINRYFAMIDSEFEPHQVAVEP